MAHTNESKKNIFKDSSVLIPENSWFQDLPHIGNVRPYGLAAARAKAQLLKDYMDGTDSLSHAFSSPGKIEQNGGAADG